MVALRSPRRVSGRASGDGVSSLDSSHSLGRGIDATPATAPELRAPQCAGVIRICMNHPKRMHKRDQLNICLGE